MPSRPQPIKSHHYPTILRNNATFVHWLSPLSRDDLRALHAVSDYARQVCAGEGVLFAYGGDSVYRHRNIDWFSERLDDFFYIDRIIIGPTAHRQGWGYRLYDDLAKYARSEGFTALACEVNTKPDNPASHSFHLAQGFQPMADVDYADNKCVRYYWRKL